MAAATTTLVLERKAFKAIQWTALMCATLARLLGYILAVMRRKQKLNHGHDGQ
jgi:hypothetical protein